MQTVMVPLEELTDAEIEAVASDKERAGDTKQAVALRAYGRCRAKFGPDPIFWPPSQVEAEGLEYNRAALLDGIGVAMEKIAYRVRADFERRGIVCTEDDLANAAMEDPALQALVNDPLATEIITVSLIDEEIKRVAAERGITLAEEPA